MIHFDLPKEKSSIIKVIGVGGGGGNAVNHMFSQQIDGVNFIICNTDAQALSNSGIPNRVQLGPHLTQGLGAGANPEIGRQATEESLEELRGILEVNTKMAFITAGMGGGTGTGGAPIIAKICKDLGILTVGIVTTPFSYEGKKRQIQAEEGIKVMKQYVDTLLVISNDKLRHQFGNLKMREAFERADNVLATAAKCITDVINSTGQINVDFADVCTVMRNGGVAILGSAAVSGEDRAHRAIEEALNSPLLNDNDIKGAKWILININSAEGEHEFTMDEVDIIQTHLVSQAGEGTDVIMGLGYDPSLGDKLGITLIATGFEYRDPFTLPTAKKTEAKQEERIVMTLGHTAEPKKPEAKKEEEKKADPLAPKLMDENSLTDVPMPALDEMIEPEYARGEEPMVHFDLFGGQIPAEKNTKTPVENNTQQQAKAPVERKTQPAKQEVLFSNQQLKTPAVNKEETDASLTPFLKNDTAKENNIPSSAAAGGYLARPSNIYAEAKKETPVTRPADEPTPPKIIVAKEEEESINLQLVEREEIPSAEMTLNHHQPADAAFQAEEAAMLDEAEDQKRKAAERLHKLRNLSFNVNAADPNNEFETVPAYIRRNMELYNSTSQIENFYSSYEVKKDHNNQTQISTINTFLEGKKPD
jgi:cell division protein FtsZ